MRQVPPKGQEMLGHASITLTIDTYSHVLPGMQEESATRLNAFVGGKVTGASPQLQGLPLAAGLAAPLEGGHLDLSPKNDGTVGSP